MSTGNIDSHSLFERLDTASNEIVGLLSPLSQQEINKAPFEKSWTAAQLTVHVTKAIASMTESIKKQAEPVERNPNGKAMELQKTFLDFGTKMETPEAVRPEEGPFNKEEVLSKLINATADFKQVANAQRLDEFIIHRAFKDISKYEIVVFIVVHTERHVHQLKKIVGAVKV